jgi:hypothetical protein
MGQIHASQSELTVEKKTLKKGTPHRSFYVPHLLAAALLLAKHPHITNSLQSPVLSIVSGYF